eukprot:992659-Prymnesium_polylepis.1
MRGLYRLPPAPVVATRAHRLPAARPLPLSAVSPPRPASSLQTPLPHTHAPRRAAGPAEGERDLRGKVTFWLTIVLRHLAALRPSTASDMKAIVL